MFDHLKARRAVLATVGAHIREELGGRRPILAQWITTKIMQAKDHAENEEELDGLMLAASAGDDVPNETSDRPIRDAIRDIWAGVKPLVIKILQQLLQWGIALIPVAVALI